MEREIKFSTEEEKLPTFENTGQDHRDEWGKLLQGSEKDFPTEASFANHYFDWPHVIDGEKREGFDCTKENSFILSAIKKYLGLSDILCK